MIHIVKVSNFLAIRGCFLSVDGRFHTYVASPRSLLYILFGIECLMSFPDLRNLLWKFRIDENIRRHSFFGRSLI